jgi:hypothetical protein
MNNMFVNTPPSSSEGGTVESPSIDLRALYQRYAAYVQALHDDHRRVDPSIQEASLLPLLSYPDFCLAWNRWGGTEGLQMIWQQRFEMGYEAHAEEIRRQLEEALVKEPK